MRTELEQDIVIVKPDRNIGQDDTEEFENTLDQEFENGVRKLLVDLSDVTHVCSSALGILVSYKRRAKQESGDLKLVMQNPDLVQLFEITMLDRVFDIFDNRKEALNDY